VLYLRYHGYSKFFPLWALARYAMRARWLLLSECDSLLSARGREGVVVTETRNSINRAPGY